MESQHSACGLCLAVGIAILSLVLWKALNLLWITPRKIERRLREQGFKGNSYKLLLGDALQFSKLLNEAMARPISLSDDTLPRVVPFVVQILQEHGNNSFGWLGTTPWLIVIDPDKIKEMLTRHEDFQKPNRPFTKLLMVGLFGYEGEKWAKHRKIINPAFHLEKLKNVLPLTHASCQKMTESWEQLLSKDGFCELDVWPHLENLTCDVISRGAFGSSPEGGQKIFHLQKEYIDLLKELMQANYIPGLRFLPTKVNRRAKAISKEVEALLMGIIEKRKLELEAGGSNKADLLGILLESNLKEIHEQGNEKAKGLTTEEVVQECKLFYLAGAETTSSMLGWTLVLLSRHQDWQERARTEIMQVFGKEQNPSFDGLNQLKVVGMILNEALRLYAPAYILLRKVFRDVKLRDWLLPAGTELIIPLSILNQDCEIWGKDAKEFNPERFSQGVSKAMKKQGLFIPFSFGPRVCIGQNFALLEAKMALTMILQRFSLHLSPTYVHAPYSSLTIKPQHGVHLILCKV